MSIETTAHLNFRGNARHALAFYQSVFGGEMMVATHQQVYPSFASAEADWVAYGHVQSTEGFAIMAFDVPSSRPYDPGIVPVFVSVRGTDAEELRRYWAGLSEDAEIIQPLAPAGFSSLYGMVKDRWGITWVLALAV